MTNPRRSYVLVVEYLLGTLNLTDFPMLTSKERYTFTPLWHGAELLASMQAMQLADLLKLEQLGAT